MSSNDDNTNDGATAQPPLSFPFRGRQVPVTHASSVSRQDASLAIRSPPFKNWVANCETSSSPSSSSSQQNTEKRIEIHSVEIQSVDMFGARGVGFVKIKSDCTLVDGETHHEHRLPGIVFLRGNAVSIFVALYCTDEATGKQQVYSLLVDQPRVPLGQASCLESPAGMLDDTSETIAGIAVKEIEEECGIQVRKSDLVDLTELARTKAGMASHVGAGIPPSGGGCDECLRYLYLEKQVTVAQLDAMKGRLAGLREHGEYITLRVVPMEDVWKISGDAKAMVSLFLCDQLRHAGLLPPPGELATPLTCDTNEPHVKLQSGRSIPQLGFGLFKVPSDEEGERIVMEAVAAGYRHFDTASYYGNEAMLGRALKKTGMPRSEFYIVSKVWNDATFEGRSAVRASVEKSLAAIDFGGYIDLFLVHWPVPGHFVDAYKELEELHKEGKLKDLGLSNFNQQEYEQLKQSGMSVKPVMNQIEVSAVMYRPSVIKYFESEGVRTCAFKPLNRASAFDQPTIREMATRYSVPPSQIMLRWGLQHGLIVISKTSTPSRMKENRSLFHFTLSEADMGLLDSLTSAEDIRKQDEEETIWKSNL